MVRPKYAVNTYRLTYLTTDGQGKEIFASALAAIPQKPVSSLSPVLGYQHATITKDAEAPSNLASIASPEVLFTSLG
jgi:hypothetical protein